MSTEVPHTPAPLDDEPDKLVLHVRDVQFDWTCTGSRTNPSPRT